MMLRRVTRFQWPAIGWWIRIRCTIRHATGYVSVFTASGRAQVSLCSSVSEFPCSDQLWITATVSGVFHFNLTSGVEMGNEQTSQWNAEMNCKSGGGGGGGGGGVWGLSDCCSKRRSRQRQSVSPLNLHSSLLPHTLWEQPTCFHSGQFITKSFSYTYISFFINLKDQWKI